MKLIIDDGIAIFLGKLININDKNDIENKILKILKNNYNIDLNGYYNVDIYIDKNYGVIIKMKKDELDYLEYFTSALELNIEIKESSFLYKIDDIFNLEKNLLNKFKIYKLKDNIYLSADQSLSLADEGILLENSKIIFGKEAEKIKNKSQIIKV